MIGTIERDLSLYLYQLFDVRGPPSPVRGLVHHVAGDIDSPRSAFALDFVGGGNDLDVGHVAQRDVSAAQGRQIDGQLADRGQVAPHSGTPQTIVSKLIWS